MVSSASTSSFNEEDSPTFKRHNELDSLENQTDKSLSNGKFKKSNGDPKNGPHEPEIELIPMDMPNCNSVRPIGVETAL